MILGSTITALGLARNSCQLGVRCILVDTKYGVAASTRKAKVIILEAVSDEYLVEYVISLAKESTSALVIDSDAGLRILIAFRKALESAFARILHPNNDVLSICLDKSRFLLWCKEEGLPAPALYRAIGDYKNVPRFPVIVRPSATRHASGNELPKAKEVANADELDQLLQLYGRYNATPCISDSLLRNDTRQYSVGVVRNESGDVRIFVAEKVRPSARFCGGGTYVIPAPDKDITRLASAAIECLDYFGIAEIEILKLNSTNEMFLVEINPRPWVQYALAWCSGFDFLAFLIAPRRYDEGRERTTGRRWLNWADDLYVTFSRSQGMMKHRELTMMSYLRSILTANVFPVWSIHDPGPAIRRLSNRIRARL